MNNRRRIPLFGLLAALVIALSLPTSSLALTRSPMAVGVSMIHSWDMSQVDAFTASTNGRKPAIWALWSDWGGPDKDFPLASAQGLQSRGIVPMINWEPVDPSNQEDCTKWSLDQINSGRYDQYIRDWATAAKNFGGRVLIRFAHEMNGYWYIWGTERCQNSPKKFKKAWKRVVTIFRGTGGVGANNVKFLWSVFGTAKVPSFYPGTAYVDYMGLTAFNWVQPGHPGWKSMVKTMAPTMTALRRLSTTKPIIVAELGAGHDPSYCSGCNKAAYITTGYPAVYAKWPQVVGMVYFNIDMTGQGQPNWRLDNPANAFDAYKAVLNDPRFQGTIP